MDTTLAAASLPNRQGQAGRPLVAVAAFLVIGLALGERFSYFPALVFGSLVIILLVRQWAQTSSMPFSLILLPLLFGLLYYQIAIRYRVASDLSPYLDQDRLTFEGQLEDPV